MGDPAGAVAACPWACRRKGVFLLLYRICAILQNDTEPTLIEELWQYFRDRYFTVDMGRYEHLELGSGSLINISHVILGLFAGVIIAAMFASYDKNKLGGFVRKLVREQCLSAETAKTLSELGYDAARGLGIRSSLKHGSVLRRVVHCVERDAHEADVAAARAAYVEKMGSEKGFDAPLFVMDFETAHFYIPDEEHYRAEVRFEEKGSGWRALLLVIVVSVICAVLICFFLPEILQMVDNMLGILKGDGNVVN